MEIKAISYNIRGAKNTIKRKALFNFFKKEKFHFICIQETHIESLFEAQLWRNSFNGKIIFSNNRSNSAGVAILFDKSVNCDFSQTDKEGRFIIANCKFEGKHFTLVNVYAPNILASRENFFGDLNNSLNEFPYFPDLIICGDFNHVLNADLDSILKSNRHPCQALSKLIVDFGLIDTWRENNPDSKTFSWSGKNRNGIISATRIDLFLCNVSHEFDLVVDYTPNIWSDHKHVILSIKYNGNVQGNNMFWWKYNSNLNSKLSDTNLVEDLLSALSRSGDLDLKKINRWSFFKYKLRLQIMNLASEIKKKNQEKISRLNFDLSHATNVYEKIPSEENASTLYKIKNELKNLIVFQTKGAAIRSRVKWYIEGERPTAYYLGLEKHNYKTKTCNKLIWNQFTASTNAEIIHLIKQFYEEFFSQKNNSTNVEHYDFDVQNKISDDLRKELEKPLSKEELLIALKGLKSTSSPGIDGLTADFYKGFWTKIGDYFIESLGLDKENPPDCLPEFFTAASTILIPKLEKNIEYLKNWRPISLLNTDYKILSKAITNRINKCLPSIISSNQIGFMRNRNIGHNICLLDDLLFEAKRSANVRGAIVLLDIEKAYDTIDRNHILETMEKMNFGPNLCKWVSLLFKDNCNNFVMNKNSTGWISIEKGVRQGDVISPALFNIALQPITEAIENNKKIKGIKIGSKIFKVTHYSDDSALFVEDSDSLNCFFELWNSLSKTTGLHLNTEKTKIIPLNLPSPWNLKKFNINFENNGFKYLGIMYKKVKKHFVRDESQKSLLIDSVGSKLSSWASRSSTMIGRSCVANVLGFSKTVFYTTYSKNNKSFWKNLKSIVQNYVWENKKPKINHKKLCESLDNGGLGLLNENVIIASKLKFITGSLNSTSCWADLFMSKFLKFGSLPFLLQCNFDLKCLNLNIRKYYREILDYWSIYNKFKMDYRKFILWNNKLIINNGRSFFIKSLYDQDIIYIGDIIGLNGHMFSEEEIAKKYYIDNVDKLKLKKLIASIPKDLIKEYLDLNCPVQLTVYSRPLLVQFCELDISSKEFNNSNIKRCLYEGLLCPDRSNSGVVTRWNEIFSDLNWQSLKNNSIKTLLPNKYVVLQLKILFNIIPTAKYLFNIKIKENPFCDNCKKIDNLFHYFIECKKIDNLWTKIKDFLFNKFNIIIQISEKNILIGIDSVKNNDLFCNLVFMIGKFVIYKSNILNTIPTFDQFFIDLYFNMGLIINKNTSAFPVYIKKMYK